MKNSAINILLLSLHFSFFTVQAQDTSAFKFFVGLRGFYQNSFIGFPETAYFYLGEYEPSRQVGPGLMLGVQFSQRASLRVEVNKMKRTFSSDYINVIPHWDEGRFAKVSFELDIVDFPVMMLWTIGKKDIRPFVGAGIKVGMIYSSKHKIDAFYDYVKPDRAPGVTIEKPIFGLLANAGVQVDVLSGLSAFLEGRYHIDQGTMYVAKIFTGSTDLNTSGFEIGIGVKYRISKS